MDVFIIKGKKINFSDLYVNAFYLCEDDRVLMLEFFGYYLENKFIEEYCFIKIKNWKKARIRENKNGEWVDLEDMGSPMGIVTRILDVQNENNTDRLSIDFECFNNSYISIRFENHRIEFKEGRMLV